MDNPDIYPWVLREMAALLRRANPGHPVVSLSSVLMLMAAKEIERLEKEPRDG